ncbi:hypothetical protein [Marinoscillum furvescens]|uniref:hypothetical protein n=1 Tax=Marinoscillum furvescens TaxID=1026 RepID=UPI000E2850AF|nr:hypothetical protein [Marinoscillum furvescens]
MSQQPPTWPHPAATSSVSQLPATVRSYQYTTDSYRPYTHSYQLKMTATAQHTAATAQKPQLPEKNGSYQKKTAATS